jgi:hypothetical protein
MSAYDPGLLPAARAIRQDSPERMGSKPHAFGVPRIRSEKPLNAGSFKQRAAQLEKVNH